VSEEVLQKEVAIPSPGEESGYRIEPDSIRIGLLQKYIFHVLNTSAHDGSFMTFEDFLLFLVFDYKIIRDMLAYEAFEKVGPTKNQADDSEKRG
jgi:hypothetical protein